MNKFDKLENGLFFIVGLFSTWMAIMMVIGNTNIGIFNFILIAIILLEIVKNRKVYLNQKTFLVFSVFSMISTIGCYFFLNELWFSSSLRATLKFMIVFVPFLLFVKKETILDKRKYFMKGLYVSVIFQLIWEFAQILFWSIGNIPLNKVIFGDLLNIDIGRNWLFWSDGRMRPTGLSWEPANLSLSLIIGYVLSEKKILKGLFILGIIMSTSRIGIGAFLVVFLFDVIRFFKEKRVINKKKIALIIPTIIVIIIAILILVNVNKGFLDYMVKNIEGTINTIAHIGDNPSANRHIEYYLRIFEAFSFLNIFQILFGVGVTCAGYPYANYLGIYSTDKVWTPETDYISILIGNGILGAIIYFYWLYGIVRKNRDNYKIIDIIIVILIMTTMAQYYRGWVTLLLILYGETNNNNNNNLIEKSKNDT